MALPSKAEFFRLLKKSRLLTPSQRVEAKRLCQGIQDQAVADELVRHNLLTPWQAAQLARGRTRFHLGKYKLLKFRGRGAMGIVFKAEHPELNRTVAIKILSNSLLGNERSVARFLREIRSAAALNHPNLVVAYDADQIDKTYCLVMEYISGRSLKVLSQEQGRLPVLWSCECARQAALALQHIHDRGLVHRDVKPSNLLVTWRPPDNRMQIKLLDVGLARFVSEAEQDGGLTRDGQIVGTGDYMAPEQVAKAKSADIRADIYGLGCTLYQLITGSIPQAAGTLLQTYINRLQTDPPLLSTQVANIPPGLDSIVAKMLKRDPQARYQTPDEVASDLAAILAGTVPESLDRATATNLDLFLEATGAADRFAFSLRSLKLVNPSDSASDVLPAGSEGSSAAIESSESSGSGSLHDFTRLMNDSSADQPLHVIRTRPASPARIRTFTLQASQAFGNLLRRLAGRRAQPNPRAVPQSTSRAPRSDSPKSAVAKRK